jgi:hypothetical protein
VLLFHFEVLFFTAGADHRHEELARPAANPASENCAITP